MHTIIFWLFAPLTFIVLFPAALLAMLLHGKKYFQGMQLIARIWARVLLWLGGVKVEVAGLENIQVEPHIFASNHQSMFDIMIVLGYLPRPFHFIAKESLFEWPLFGWVMHWAGYFPINRESPGAARRTMDAIVRHIKEENASILIFPEGTRSKDGQLQPFKKGCAALACETGATVYPVGIQNSWKITLKGSLKIDPSLVSLKIGKGMVFTRRTPEESNAQELYSVTQQIHTEISRLI
jgi:1-acyl-sn-glycerol-3-phosphate acyltransferase